MANGLFGGGNGTEVKPYLVEDAADLNAVRLNMKAHYQQVNNIDLSVYENWKSIGYMGYDDIGNSISDFDFSGYYNGDDFTVNNITCIVSDRYEGGLFGICTNARIENVKIKKVRVSGNEDTYSGGFACVLNGCIIDNCSVQDAIFNVPNGNAAGFSPHIEIDSVVSKCSVDGLSIVANTAGGFAIFKRSHVENCYVVRAEISGFRYGGCFLWENSEGETINCFAVTKLNGFDRRSVVFPFASSHSLTDSCYTDVSVGGPFNGWLPDIYYDSKTYIRGTDNVLYKCITDQPARDYTWDDAWNETGPPEGFPPIFYEAQPISGSSWSVYWTASDDPESRNTQQMMMKENYIGWDFKEIWNIREGESYPFLRKPKTVSKTQCQRMPMGGFLRI